MCGLSGCGADGALNPVDPVPSLLSFSFVTLDKEYFAGLLHEPHCRVSDASST